MEDILKVLFILMLAFIGLCLLPAVLVAKSFMLCWVVVEDVMDWATK